MDPTRRHFINQLPDYSGGDVSPPSADLLTRRLLDHVKAISTKWDKSARVCVRVGRVLLGRDWG